VTPAINTYSAAKRRKRHKKQEFSFVSFALFCGNNFYVLTCSATVPPSICAGVTPARQPAGRWRYKQKKRQQDAASLQFAGGTPALQFSL
jgi:hypothetical protein